ncbi:hypothetical protein QCA50_014961 [Cerrena zonata]|uniref:Small ribosomal subunit protein uS10m n=1 Tax=Cerrena zonata TaxID=2478898 RepID=A0AAW0FPD6_9APHY
MFGIGRQCNRTLSLASRIASGSRLSHTLPAINQTGLSAASQNELSELLGQPEVAGQIVNGRSFLPAYYHPRTHNVPVALIHFRSYHISLLNLFTHFASHAASALAIPISKTIPLPTQRSLWTVPRSPFVHKTSQENFERRTHKRVIKAWDADDEVVERWIKYLEAHPLAGVGFRVDRLVLDMQTKKTRSAEKVKELGEKIVERELAAAAASAQKSAETIVKSS